MHKNFCFPTWLRFLSVFACFYTSKCTLQATILKWSSIAESKDTSGIVVRESEIRLISYRAVFMLSSFLTYSTYCTRIKYMLSHLFILMSVRFSISSISNEYIHPASNRRSCSSSQLSLGTLTLDPSLRIITCVPWLITLHCIISYHMPIHATRPACV